MKSKFLNAAINKVDQAVGTILRVLVPTAWGAFVFFGLSEVLGLDQFNYYMSAVIACAAVSIFSQERNSLMND